MLSSHHTGLLAKANIPTMQFLIEILKQAQSKFISNIDRVYMELLKKYIVGYIVT